MKKLIPLILLTALVGCTEYPTRKINCTVKTMPDGIELNTSYAFVDANLFGDAEVEIFDEYPNTYKCESYVQNNSSIRCNFKMIDQIHFIQYNKIGKTMRYEIDFIGVSEETPRISIIGSCKDS